MDQATVFTKTAKGITQVNQRTASLSKDLMKVLKLIDGKSNFTQIMEKAELDKNQLEKALNTLTKDGFARVFQTRKEELDPFADEGDDFDFTAPGKMPAATQRVIAGAANDITELARQHEKQDADRKAKEAAHSAAAAKAKAEAQVRAKLEAEAKARQEAERQALEQAKRAKEAAERAKAEAEAQARQEEARKKALAEQQAKLTAEQKAKEEAESRRLAELRVKAEREAKALAEARARAEAEAAAMAKARAEAEAAAKRKAEEADKAQAEMKARLKEEIESRIRGEMEDLLRNEVEEKTREELKAQIMAEAKLAAKAELEERLQEERDAIARAEAEARTRAESEASKRAEEEARKRAEAEARAKAETEARIRAEEEAKRLRAQVEAESKRASEAAATAKAEAEARARAAIEAERKGKQEAEARARAEAEARAREAAEVEKRLDAERQAKYEAEARAKIEAEESEKRQRQLAGEIEVARKAKEEAEARARTEAKARETIEVDTRARVQAEIEGDMAKRAEIEGKAQARAYMEAKVKAEQEEEDKQRQEQERRAREIADVLRTKVEAREDAVEQAMSPKRRGGAGGLVKMAVVGLVLLLAIGIGVLHLVPLKPFTSKVERALGEWLKDDVTIGSMVFRGASLKVTDVAVGKSLDAKAANGTVEVDVLSLFGSDPKIREVYLENVQISAEAVRRIPLWGKVEGKPEASPLQRIRLRGVAMETKPPVEPFDATLTFARDGTLQKANLNAPSGWSLALAPADAGWEFDASVRNMNLPFGAPIPIDSATAKGVWLGNAITVPEFEAKVLDGTVKGTLKLTWGGPVRVESDLSLDQVAVQQLVSAFHKGISLSGKLNGNFSFVSEGPSLESMFATPKAIGKFKLTEGAFGNADLVAVVQSDTAAAGKAGRTPFNEISGELTSTEQRSAFHKVALEGGLVKGSGAFDIAGGNLGGRVTLEVKSRQVSAAGSFGLSGTPARPVFKRGG